MIAIEMIRQAEDRLEERFRQMEEVAYCNQIKVLQAFQKEKVRDIHFNPSSGYGYGDQGRDSLEAIYARVFQSEDALVRGQIVSGTHADFACLFGLLREGDRLVSISGSPYDTLGRVIGKGEQLLPGTLMERGINYDEIPLNSEGCPDLPRISREIDAGVKMVLIQRSRGYSLRPALTVESIVDMAGMVRRASPETIIMVDNCYGEFTQLEEPGPYVDLMAGSLIKNPGGGLAPAGGYICGKGELVEQVAYHVTAPGLGKEMGATLAGGRSFYQGFFLAPHVVLQALKGAALLAYVFEQAGYRVKPRWQEDRPDIVQAIKLNNERESLQFCQVVQSSSPVDSDLTLEFASMPGYQDKIVMAAGTFISGFID